ncbi:hypothetical protein AB8O38_04730 [Saccharomonospora xinjiangensis]|uniref:hypothetical protein n=1 Tax=Saccharomonospora xinjiangensis TaxID=75294 RepID=UPI00350F5544
MAEPGMNEGAGRAVPSDALSKAMAAMDKSMGAKAMEEVTRSADRLVESAKSGGFRVTKEGADPIIKVLEEFIKRTREISGDLQIFDKAPQLGNHAYGIKVANFMHDAANDGQSARAAVESLKIILEKSREALLWASSQYQEQEELSKDAFRKLGD